MAPSAVVLILGAGPRIGSSVAHKFASNGYKVAVASRSGASTTDSDGFLSLKVDLSNPQSIPGLFESVSAELGAPPSVVVYNAAALSPPPVKDALFSLSLDTLQKDLNVNTTSPYVAAQQAVKGWEKLPGETKKSFIYTGNILNVKIVPVPMMMTLGAGKSASAYWIGTADAVYSPQGYRFFYADERSADGANRSMVNLDGAAHAEFFSQLAAHEGDVPWYATFVKDKGYVKF